MKNSTYHHLITPLFLVLTCTYSLQSMEHETLTPDLVALTIHSSDNPNLDPLKVEINVLSEQLEQIRKGASDRQTKRRFGSGDDAGAAPALLTQQIPSTPFNTPAKPKKSRKKQDRPTPVKTDTGVGLGSMSLSPFDNLSDSSPLAPQVPPSSPAFQEQAQALSKSILNLEALSKKLLENSNLLTEQEKKAVAYINTQSKKALYADERVIGSAALGLGAGALAWAAYINPFRVYKECCSQHKFTGLELPALITAGKALLGPVLALVALGVAWYKFKQWIVEPYQEAHKSEVDKFKDALAKHKKEIAEQLEKTHKQSDETLKEVASTLALVKKNTNEQLERTLKTVAESEEDLKKKITEFIQKTKSFQATITDNVHDLQESRDDLKATTATLVEQQKQILRLVDKIKKDEEQLLYILKNKPLTSPASAPVGKAATPTSLLREPQSAQVQGTKPKKSWLGFAGRSPKVAPSPQSQPSRALTNTPEDSPMQKPHLTIITSPTELGESKRSASRSNPTPETV